MRRAILMLLLAVVSNNVMAEWIKVNSGGGGNVTVYTDFSTRSQNGNRVKLWDLMDYRTRQTGNVMSLKRQVEYDCKEVKMRVFYSSIHSENMGRGETVAYPNPDVWTPVPPGTIGENLWHIACRK